MRNLSFISVIPDDSRWVWETSVHLYNLREYGYSKYSRILVFLPGSRLKKGWNPQWKELEKLFPEVKFFYYADSANGRVDKLIKAFSYIPIHRLHCLQIHFQEHPYLKEEAIFYCDTDILFTKHLDFSLFLQDDVCYLSDTSSYLGPNHFFGKRDSLSEQKKIEYDERRILDGAAKICGITELDVIKNENCTGGAQHLLKNIDSQFWEECLNNCAELRTYFLHINEEFFPGNTREERENNGIQRWCSDMWAVLWNLWRRNITTATPKEFDFAWSTDEIEAWNRCYIMHNAGITSDAVLRTRRKDASGQNIEIEAPVFFKGDYDGRSPFDDAEFIQAISEHPETKKYCNSKYCEAIIKTKNNLKL